METGFEEAAEVGRGIVSYSGIASNENEQDRNEQGKKEAQKGTEERPRERDSQLVDQLDEVLLFLLLLSSFSLRARPSTVRSLTRAPQLLISRRQHRRRRRPSSRSSHLLSSRAGWQERRASCRLMLHLLLLLLHLSLVLLLLLVLSLLLLLLLLLLMLERSWSSRSRCW